MALAHTGTRVLALPLLAPIATASPGTQFGTLEARKTIRDRLDPTWPDLYAQAGSDGVGCGVDLGPGLGSIRANARCP